MVDQVARCVVVALGAAVSSRRLALGAERDRTVAGIALAYDARQFDERILFEPGRVSGLASIRLVSIAALVLDRSVRATGHGARDFSGDCGAPCAPAIHPALSHLLRGLHAENAKAGGKNQGDCMYETQAGQCCLSIFSVNKT